MKQEVKMSFDSLDNEFVCSSGCICKRESCFSGSCFIIYERFVSYNYPDKAAAQYAKLAAAAQQSVYGKLIAKSRKMMQKQPSAANLLLHRQIRPVTG